MTNTKITLIQELHNIYTTQHDMLLVQARIEALLHQYRVTFKKPQDQYPFLTLVDQEDTRTLFFEALYNDTRAQDIQIFAVTCEAYLDFTPLTHHKTTAP